MSKTRRKGTKRSFEDQPLRRHVSLRKCDGCGEWFEKEEMWPGKDDSGRPTGWYCGCCI